MLIAWTCVRHRAEADQLADAAIRQGLAACVQIEGPITSHYRWQGQVEHSEEFRLCFKFRPSQLSALETFVLGRHTYEIPEWMVVAAERVSEKYLSWAETTSTNPSL